MNCAAQHVHFLGIGGIGMSALARIQLQRGCAVSGSDCRASESTAQLQGMGARIDFAHAPENIDRLARKNPRIVLSSSIRADNPEVMRAAALKLTLQHRADLLGELALERTSIGVTGSHGKTSTCALLVHLLEQQDPDISFALGGLLKLGRTNGRWRDGQLFALEIDESDGRSFHIPLRGGILTNISREHLDFWQSFSNLSAAFGAWAHSLSDPDLLLWCADDPLCREVTCGRGWSYGVSEKADFRVLNSRCSGHSMRFDLQLPTKAIWRELQISQIGHHQILNSAAAIALAHLLNLDQALIRRALATHAGVARRGELCGYLRVGSQRIAVFDDYAHHPKEVRATLRALRDFCGEKMLVALFQPHRYSRLRDCFGEFLAAFDSADLVYILPIYTAGEAPLPNIDSAELVRQLQKSSKARCRLWRGLVSQEEMLAKFDEGGALCTLGAGDITSLRENWQLEP